MNPSLVINVVLLIILIIGIVLIIKSEQKTKDTITQLQKLSQKIEEIKKNKPILSPSPSPSPVISEIITYPYYTPIYPTFNYPYRSYQPRRWDYGQRFRPRSPGRVGRR